MRLALKLFRGEPAISGFDWNFSPIHTSSPPFSTDVRADLQSLLRLLHPGDLVSLRVSALWRFPSPEIATRRTVLQKVRGRAYRI